MLSKSAELDVLFRFSGTPKGTPEPTLAPHIVQAYRFDREVEEPQIVNLPIQDAVGPIDLGIIETVAGGVMQRVDFGSSRGVRLTSEVSAQSATGNLQELYLTGSDEAIWSFHIRKSGVLTLNSYLTCKTRIWLIAMPKSVLKVVVSSGSISTP